MSGCGGTGNERVSMKCSLRFQMNLWCGLDLGFVFWLTISVRVRITAMVTYGSWGYILEF